MPEQLIGAQDAPEGVNATTAQPDLQAPERITGAVPGVVYSSAPDPVPVASQGRTETFEVEGPDGICIVTRDLDSGEQTTTHPDGTVYREGPVAQQAEASLATPTRLAPRTDA